MGERVTDERLAEQLHIERAIATGGLAVAVRMLLERMDRFQRSLDTMQDNQGNLIRQGNSLWVAVNKICETTEAARAKG